MGTFYEESGQEVFAYVTNFVLTAVRNMLVVWSLDLIIVKYGWHIAHSVGSEAYLLIECMNE